jgi:hypothetical protein
MPTSPRSALLRSECWQAQLVNIEDYQAGNQHLRRARGVRAAWPQPLRRRAVSLFEACSRPSREARRQDSAARPKTEPMTAFPYPQQSWPSKAAHLECAIPASRRDPPSPLREPPPRRSPLSHLADCSLFEDSGAIRSPIPIHSWTTAAVSGLRSLSWSGSRQSRGGSRRSRG